MYRKILVPLDGSDLADAILPHVQTIAQCHGAEIVLVHVLVSPMYDLLLTGPKLAHVMRQNATAIHPSAKVHLERVAASLKESGLVVTVEIQEGLVVDTILDLARKHAVDLIAMSTHGQGGKTISLLGSVTYRLIHDSRLPVLLVPPEQEPFVGAP